MNQLVNWHKEIEGGSVARFWAEDGTNKSLEHAITYTSGWGNVAGSQSERCSDRTGRD